MAVPPAPAAAGLSDPHDRTPSHRFRLVLAGLLAVLLVASLGVLAWLLVGRDAEEKQAAREQVMSVANQFLLRMGTYGPDLLDESGKLPEYRERVSEMITPKFSADFEKQVDTLEQLVAQSGVARETEIFATGVSSLDDDSARVLVAGVFRDSYTQGTGKKAETVRQEPFPFRLRLDLEKIEGEWLVDDFTGVTSEEGGDPSTGVVPDQSPPAPTEEPDRRDGRKGGRR